MATYKSFPIPELPQESFKNDKSDDPIAIYEQVSRNASQLDVDLSKI